jgi:outer membrane protein assembly factor BamB
VKLLVLLGAVALLAPAPAAAQVAAAPTPTVTPAPEPEPEPQPEQRPLPPAVEPPPPGTQTVTQGFDLAHSFYSAEPAARPPFGVVWRKDFGGPPSSPLIAGGRAFVSTSKGDREGAALIALDAASGRELWRATISTVSFAMYLGYGDGVLVGADSNGKLHAFDAATGTHRWTREFSYTNSSHPVVAGGLVYLQSNSDVLVFDLGSGEERFRAKLGDGTAGVPAISGDRLYVLGSCRAGAFDRRDGRMIWTLDDRGCTGGGGARAVLHGRRVVGSEEFFLDAENGARLGGRQPVAVAAGDVGIADGPQNQGISAFNLDSGAPLWRYEPDAGASGSYGSVGSGALAAAGETVLWRYGHILHAFDRRTGALGWRGRLAFTDSHGQGTGNQDFAIGDGVVLVPLGSSLYALSANAPDVPPKLTVRRLGTGPLIFAGPGTRISGRVTSEGLAYDHPLTLEASPFPYRGFRRKATKPLVTDGTFNLGVKPSLNTVYRVSIPGARPKTFGLVVLPRMSSKRLDRSTGSVGRMRLNVRVPRSVRIAGHTVGLYVARGARRRFVRLGSGRLRGRRGRYSATFSFAIVSRIGERDFIATCVRGIHRKGMSFGDRLDRGCGRVNIRF